MRASAISSLSEAAGISGRATTMTACGAVLAMAWSSRAMSSPLRGFITVATSMELDATSTL